MDGDRHGRDLSLRQEKTKNCSAHATAHGNGDPSTRHWVCQKVSEVFRSKTCRDKKAKHSANRCRRKWIATEKKGAAEQRIGTDKPMGSGRSGFIRLSVCIRCASLPPPISSGVNVYSSYTSPSIFRSVISIRRCERGLLVRHAFRGQPRVQLKHLRDEREPCGRAARRRRDRRSRSTRMGRASRSTFLTSGNNLARVGKRTFPE